MKVLSMTGLFSTKSSIGEYMISDMLNDTIAAIASGTGNAGIGIIRVSGNNAIDIVDNIFTPKNNKKSVSKLDSYQAAYGHIVSDGEIIDEVIVLVMKAPSTYTREDVVEIDCHGGRIVINSILELLVKAGARIAEPGEFTKRAFLNGRVDLSQAESVIDLINAKTEFAAKSSIKHLEGQLSKKIDEYRSTILYNLSYIESALDDPEHYSLEGYGDKLRDIAQDLIRSIDILIEGSNNGRILTEGIKTVIVGKPNAGKSSILNVLLGEDRAIVTDIAGTTRDTLEESININGIPINIVDTAGIRTTEDIVEKIGVDKAKNNIDMGDLILYVVDGSVPLDDNDYHIIDLIKDKNVIIIINKSDLDVVVDKMLIKSLINKDIVDISSKDVDGFEELYDILKRMFFNGDISYNDEIYVTNIRHKDALMKCRDSLNNVLASIDNDMPEDFYSIDLRDSYEELGYIIGKSMGDDLVNEIFSKFCMGK